MNQEVEEEKLTIEKRCRRAEGRCGLLPGQIQVGAAIIKTSSPCGRSHDVCPRAHSTGGAHELV